MKTLFEELGGTYREENGYLLPSLTLPEEKPQPIGIWSQRHLQFMKKKHYSTYITLLTTGKLNAYLAEINKQAEAMYDRLMKQLTQSEGITEQLKAKNQMEWFRRMNNLRERATEIVNAELILV